MIGCVPNSTVEDYSTPKSKVDGSNPANATESEKKLEEKISSPATLGRLQPSHKY
jgi:hypothetical protein